MTTVLDCPILPNLDSDPDPDLDAADATSPQADRAFDSGDFDAAGFARELDQLRADILGSLGAEDAEYIHRLIRTQRRLEIGGRAALLVGLFPPAWDLSHVMFSSGGSEANETNFKLARMYWALKGEDRRKTIVARNHGYHGLTIATMSATGIMPITGFPPVVVERFTTAIALAL